MYKRLMIMVWVLAVLIGISSVHAQDDVLQILAIDYLGDALTEAGVYEQGINIDVTVVDQRAMGVIIVDGSIREFDLILVDNQIIDPIIPQLGEDFFIPLCELVPELCPRIPDICQFNPWLPICRNPCPPTSLSCPPFLWDVPIIVDPWDPMPWTLDTLIEVVETETVMVDPRNGVGFFLKPAIFDIARPNLTIELEEAFLVFTPACNYIMHFDEFNEKGFLPITVEGYQETPFNVSSYIVAEGNVDLAAEFASMLITNPDVQMSLFEATGLLPSNLDVLGEIMPS